MWILNTLDGRFRIREITQHYTQIQYGRQFTAYWDYDGMWIVLCILNNKSHAIKLKYLLNSDV